MLQFLFKEMCLQQESLKAFIAKLRKEKAPHNFFVSLYFIKLLRAKNNQDRCSLKIMCVYIAKCVV